jgi:hypothetical protein
MAGKGLRTTDHYGAAGHVLDAMSKNALADFVVELVREVEGDMGLDGLALVDAVRRRFEHVARLRGDRVPPTPRRFKRSTAAGVRYGWTLSKELPKVWPDAEWAD